MKRTLLLAVSLGCALPTAWAGEPSGQTIAFACAGCHGVKDLGKGSVPVLKGQDAAYLEKALLEFKSGARTGATGTIMPRIVKGFTDSELKAVAEYYGSLK